jgi:hypothetical protein
MNSPPFSHIFIIFITTLSPVFTIAADPTITFIYKGCADTNFPNPSEPYTQTLNTLFQTLISQSSTTKFYKTTAGDGNGQSSIVGVFQCRGDLTNSNCQNCVSKIPKLIQKLCGKTIASRVQLTGCYLRYELTGFQQVPGDQMLYKICGSGQGTESGFGERLDSALQEVVKGVGNGNGFYAGGFNSVYVLGQCEGDLGSGDCVQCIKTGVDRVKSECGSTISGQMYMQQCYISYSYYPNGVPNRSQPGIGAETGIEMGNKPNNHNNTQKTVAIVVGGVAGLGLGIACLLVLRSAFIKKRDKY